MKFAAKQICINPKHATEPAGHIQQTYKLTEVHDDLHARILILSDELTFIHISCDNLGFDVSVQEKIQQHIEHLFSEPVHVVISCTHSHHCANPKDPIYVQQVISQLTEAIQSIELKTFNKMEVTFRTETFDEVGKSRISHHTANVLLNLIELYGDDQLLATMIIHNAHPTILAATTPYFSAEYPGFALSRLHQENPGQFFTFMQGADGDISSRFTRKSQDYAGVEDLGNKLVNKIKQMKSIPADKKSCKLNFHSQIVTIDHEFKPIDLGEIPSDLTDRELETINYGQIIRERLSENKDSMIQSIHISMIDFGGPRIIFMPNEMFSFYINMVDSRHTSLACYSNGYSYYVTGPGSKLLTYETFTDTYTTETKNRIIDLLKQWGN